MTTCPACGIETDLPLHCGDLALCRACAFECAGEMQGREAWHRWCRALDIDAKRTHRAPSEVAVTAEALGEMLHREWLSG